MAEDRTYSHPESVVCVARPEHAKSGATYFGKIIPFAISDLPDDVVADGVPEDWKKSTRKLADSMRRRLSVGPNVKVKIKNPDESSLLFTGENDADTYASVLEHAYVDNTTDFRSRLLLGLSAAGFTNVPIIISSSSIPSKASTLDDITLSLTNLDLIDFRNASWEQVLELRKDRESQAKLRNLRVFLHKEYIGKDIAYIEDHLQKTIDDYANAVRDHGFTTLTSTLSTLLSSKSLLATIGTTAAAILFGTPLQAAVTGTISSSYELGKVVVEVAKHRHAFNKLKRDHPVAFIADAQQRLGISK